jgi:hypothetical protein
MSATLISSLNLAASKKYVAMSVPLIIDGVFNVIIFLSLQLYQQSSSAFYLTVVSIVKVGQLLTGFLSRVLINSSPPFC